MGRINLADHKDTIAAISTPLAPGGIGIVRLSGKRALAIADKMFEAKSGTKASRAKTFTVHYGWVREPGTKKKQSAGAVDEALMTVMRSPRSYTTEDVVEFSCHGGTVVLKKILRLMLDNGARLAQPGEFTKRAFLNGRIDLTQAEAVLDIIRSRTEAFLRVSTNQLKGELTEDLEAMREQLMEVYTQLEAILNFPEDETGVDDKAERQMARRVSKVFNHIEELIRTGERGQIIRDGVKAVICGKPNAGKSSLLNVLLKNPRAIVTEVEGTTRDTIEEGALIGGIPFQLVDTAGILEPRDKIEREAVRRSQRSIRQADLVLFVLDGSRRVSEQDRDLAQRLKGLNVLVVVNKCDLDQKLSDRAREELGQGHKTVQVSALKKKGISALERAMVSTVMRADDIRTDIPMICNVRHLDALTRCAKIIAKIEQDLGSGMPLEFVSHQVSDAVRTLDEITGRHLDADLLERIFSEFCIGK